MLKEALRALGGAARPVLIYGAGVRLAGAGKAARAFARMTGVPVAPTWGARDLFPDDDPRFLCVGGFGTHGTRAANFAVQNADWILSVGSRLDSKATGTPREYFARGADIFMVDIDPCEIAKFGGRLGRSFRGVVADARMFLRDAAAQLPDVSPLLGPWRDCCRDWLSKYPAVALGRPDAVDPYALVDALSECCQPGDVIVSDTGLSLAWMMQAFRFKRGQQFVHAFNQTPMGYGLPAAIGAAYARPGQRVVHVTGDGGFMLNSQELSVVARRSLPIKIVLFDNFGHGMCRQTQDQWLEGKHYSTSTSTGLCMPYIPSVAEALGIRAAALMAPAQPRAYLDWLFRGPDPALLRAKIPEDARLIPQVQYGKPNEDGSPPLPRDELAAQMIVGTV